MIIFDDNSRPILLDSIYVPLVTQHMWILDLNMMDYTLSPITILEEITAPSMMVQIHGFAFMLPTTWYMLVFDEETMQLDSVCVEDLPGKEFTALVSGPTLQKAMPGKVIVVDYDSKFKNVGPLLNKHQMLCHPISTDMWVSVSPTDVYNKYLKEKIVGDIL